LQHSHPSPFIRFRDSKDYAYGFLSVEDVSSFLEPAGPAASNRPLVDPGVEEFTVIPGRFGVRWLISADSRQCREVLSCWRPYDLRSRVKWGVVEAASAVSALEYLPGTTRVSLPLGHLRNYFREIGKEGIRTAVIQVGNPSFSRKLIAFGMGDRSVECVVKIPLTSDAVESIAREAHALSELRALTRALPECISCDSSSGWSSQTWIRGRASSRRFSRLHSDFLLRLVSDGQTLPLTQAVEHICPPSTGDLRPTHIVSAIADAATRVLLLSDALLPVTCVHGDFVPWNIKNNSGELVIVDWESCILTGLPLQDVCHFFYKQDYLFQDIGGLPQTMLRHPAVSVYLKKMDISADTAVRLVLYYLVETYYTHLSHKEYDQCEYDEIQIKCVMDGIGRS
jgi:hypothetical protein